MDLTKTNLNLLQFEYWSQLCLRKFYAPSVTGRPVYRVLRKKAFQHDHILCVVGSIGSGKSIATQTFRGEAGYSEVNSGRVLARLMGIPPVPDTPRQVFQDEAQAFIANEVGPKALAYAILEEARKQASSRIVIDGIRHPETLRALRESSKRPIAVLYIHTPPDVAYELYTNREAPREPLLPAEFAHLQNATVEAQVRYLIDDADAVVYNWFGLESYRFVIRQLISELGLKHDAAQRRRIR